MEKDLSNYRKSYEQGELLLKDTPDNPMELFEQWFQEVDHFFPKEETNAMTISTIGTDGFPKSRVVLLKKYNDKGFVFYTNYQSEKGKAILSNPKVCLSFFWAKAERQIIIKGIAKKTSEDLSNTYFKSRPKGSQLGAIASNQSEPIENRELLERKLETLEKAYQDKSIERPKFWGGFIIEPTSIEFWQGRANRLHDRIYYNLNTNSIWTKTRLQP